MFQRTQLQGLGAQGGVGFKLEEGCTEPPVGLCPERLGLFMRTKVARDVRNYEIDPNVFLGQG